jgi:hypothetical protein
MWPRCGTIRPSTNFRRASLTVEMIKMRSSGILWDLLRYLGLEMGWGILKV